jgi:hypothetical protein
MPRGRFDALGLQMLDLRLPARIASHARHNCHACTQPRRGLIRTLAAWALKKIGSFQRLPRPGQPDAAHHIFQFGAAQNNDIPICHVLIADSPARKDRGRITLYY